MAAPLNTEKKKSKISKQRMMKLNKITLAVLTVMTFAACSEQSDFTQADIVNAAVENANTPIGFGVYTGGQGNTRAGIAGPITTEVLKTYDAVTPANTVGFGVFAYNTATTDWTSGTHVGPNFMYNQHVYFNSSWQYSPLKYWPNGIDAANAANAPSNTATQEASNIQKLSFFAYAPYVDVYTDAATATAASKSLGDVTGDATSGITALSANNVDNTDPAVTYKLANASSTSAVDLLWGTRGQTTYRESDNTDNTVDPLSTETPYNYNVNLTKQTTTERVNFLFKHALAQVGGATGLKVTYDLDANSNTPLAAGVGSDANTLVTVSSVTILAKASSITTDGKFNISTGTWSDFTQGTATFSTTISGDLLNTAVKEVTPAWSGTAWTTPDGGGVNATLKDLCASGAAVPSLYLIPDASNEQTLTVSITYVVRTYDAKLDPTVASGDEGTWTKVTQTITNDVVLPAAGLAVNKKYTLVLHLGLTSVKFSAEVSDWDDAGVIKEVWLPSNVVKGYTTVAATATSTTIDISEFGIGNYASNSIVTDADVSTVSGTGTTVTVNFDAANATTTKKENVITVTGESGTVTLVVTHSPAALTIDTPTWGTSPIASSGGTITLSTLKLGDNAIKTADATTITITATHSGGTPASETLTGAITADGVLTITAPAYSSGSQNVTWTVTKITIDDTSVDLSSSNMFEVSKTS